MRTISKSTVHKVFRHGTHEQLEKSVNRWLKNGVATITDEYYDVSNYYKDNSIQIELNISEHNGQVKYKSGAVVVTDSSGWWLLEASL